MKRFAVVFALSAVATALAGGSWMQQASGVGRSFDRQNAAKYARQNLKQELDALEARCNEMQGRASVEQSDEAYCTQYPTNWQCTAVGRVTCRFP